MKKMEFTATVKISVEPAGNGANLKNTHVRLSLSNDLEREAYFKDGLPNLDGNAVLTTILIQGLLVMIHGQHQRQERDSAEHLRFIITELERGFVEHYEVKVGTL